MVQSSLATFTPSPDPTRDGTIFLCYSAVGAVLCYACVLAARPRTDTIAFVLAPILCVALSYENLSLGVSALATGAVGGGFLSLRGTVYAFIIPLWVLALFELSYTVHKRRSANFLWGIFTFDQGHRRTHTLVSHTVRYSLWGVAIALLLAQLTLDAPYTSAPDAAPRTARFSYKGQPVPWGERAAERAPLDAQDCIDLFPWVVFLAWALVSGLSLWRYGTQMSTDINPTSINAWGLVFIASLLVAAAWVFSPPAWPYPYATNAAELLLAAALVNTMGLVEANLRTLEQWDRTLGAAGQAVAVAAAANAARKHREALEDAAVAAAAAVGEAGVAAAVAHPYLTASGRSRSSSVRRVGGALLSPSQLAVAGEGAEEARQQAGTAVGGGGALAGGRAATPAALSAGADAAAADAARAVLVDGGWES